MKAHVHYEAAFEHYLQAGGIPYVAVDEAKRAAFREAKLKSFDFIVYSEFNSNWLVDVKGRRWAARKNQRKPRWENWVTQADLDGLAAWEEVFGPDFAALFVFAYLIKDLASPPTDLIHRFRDEEYVFVCMPLSEYRMHAKQRSPKWGTVNMPTAEFARYARPAGELIGSG